MKANRFLEKLTSNLPAKIICLVIASFLYLFYQLSLIDKKTFVVPLRVIQNGSVVKIGDVPASVKVVVRSNRADANVIHPEGIRATLNLDHLSENGTFDVPVFLEVDDEMLSVDPLELKVKPEYIPVTVEKKATKSIRIESLFVGEVAYGYVFSESTVTPSFIYITGPESIVKNTQSVLTEAIDISGLNSNENFDVNIIKSNKALEYIEKVESYEVEVVIKPLDMERDFKNVELTCVNLSNDLLLSDELPLLNLKIGGTFDLLEDFELPSNVAIVDFEAITEEGVYTLPVRIRIPWQLTVIEKSFSSVTVNIEKKQIDAEYEINPESL